MNALNITATAPASLALFLIPAAKMLAISASLFLSGINFAASHITRPILSALDPQPTSPSHFAELYHRSARVGVPFALVSGLSSALMAILTHGQARRAPWIAAAVCMFATLPFARVVGRETAGVRQRSADESGKVLLVDDGVHDGAETSRQLRRWRRMGLFRSAFAVVGGALPLFAVVSRN